MGRVKDITFALAAILVFVVVYAHPFNAGSCPPKHKVYNDKPVCHSDADCQKYGKICCPNQYNTKSCTDRAPFKYDNTDKKVPSGGLDKGTGVYCNGLKCQPWEVCKPDQFTKKLRCQRA